MRTILLAHVKRVVIKIGSGVISDLNGLDLERIAILCEDVHALRQRGYEVILVSSAAVAAGKADLGITGSALSLPLPLKQAAAAIGQSRLMRAYKDALRKHGLSLGQVAGQVLAHHVLGEDSFALEPRIKVAKVGPGELTGRDPRTSRVRERSGCSIVAVERGDDVIVDFDEGFAFAADDAVYVCGTAKAVARYREVFLPDE